MTYTNIQAVYKQLYNKTIKTCWIADAKRALNLTTRKSANRINAEFAKYPCPTVEVKNRIIAIIELQ